MVNGRIVSYCQVGLDFYEFLKETGRASVTDKEQLKVIYNSEFRDRNAGIKDPCFGSVLYGLRSCNKLVRGRRRNNQIRFNTKAKALYLDQWHVPRSQPSAPEQNGACGSESIQGFESTDDAETGVRGRRKLATLLMKKLEIDRSQFISDKNGVQITSDSHFVDGRLPLCMEDTFEYKLYLYVENTGKETVYFTYYTPLHYLRYFTLSDEQKVTKKKPLLLEPGDTYKIEVHFSCSLVGYYPATLAFEFKDLQATTTFHIVRYIEAQCITTLGKELAPVAPYKPRSLPTWVPQTDFSIVDGLRPDGLSVMQLKNEVELKPYLIPDYMNQLIKALKQPGSSSDRREYLLETPLCWENYSEKFNLLLYLEEQQMEVDIKRYNIPNSEKEEATMVRDTINKKLLILEVPGVSENRPSVLRGDQLLVYPVGQTGTKYRGYVHSVQLDSVKLGFSSQLLDFFVEGMKFNVEFTINRLTVRVQHRAVEFAARYELEPVLFPTAPPSSNGQPALRDLRLFDHKLMDNPEQYKAVQHIVAGSSKPAPYLVFGPPGTGKTVTVVEAIKQIESTEQTCHILACAPSNSAADLLCRKILEHVDNHKVFRMYASSRDPQLVPEKLEKFSNLVGNSYVYPVKEKLMEYRIMVTTLVTAGRLVSGNIPIGHFTHVFVDEAGHAVETECIIPLAGLLKAGSGQVVLAGDPKQLGPIIRSPFAQKYGLDVSLLERMMKNIPLYEKDKDKDVFDSRFVTKLIRNYRSHPAILKVPNQLFYDEELIPCADEILRSSYCRWEHLPKQNFPVIFHGVTGVDEREKTSPSFFNVSEVEVLMGYVRKVLEGGGRNGVPRIGPKDIGIIAPYRKQVQKIRKALQKVEKDFKNTAMEHLKVGSVEEFQGQERMVIMVSAVRSSPNYAQIDKQFNLGFIKNEKRFNVAVTRAKALLIVVGNPRVLRTDPTWNCFLQYCKDEGGYTGYDHREEDIDVVERLAALYITIEEQVETAESIIQQHLDPEWRNDL